MIIFLIWWFSVGLPLATSLYYIDLLNASCVDSPWWIPVMAAVWPIAFWMVSYGAYTNYKWRKEKGDVL